MSRRERIDVALVGFERVGLEPMIGDAAVVWLERLEDVRAVVTSVPPGSTTRKAHALHHCHASLRR